MGKEGTVPGMKKLLTVLAAILLTVSLLAAACTAAAEEEIYAADGPVITGTLDTPIGSDAAENYIRRAFGLIGEAPRRRLAPLTGCNAVVYNALADMARAVAAGERTSTVCDIPLSLLGIKPSYTAEELGYSSLIVDDQFVDEAFNSFYDAVDAEASINLQQIILALKNSIPYDLYWFGNRFRGELPDCSSDGESIFFPDPENDCYSVSMIVSQDYSIERAEGTTDCDPSYGTRIRNAAATANSIVSACAGQPVYDRLVYYRNAICSAVSYNDDALDPSTPYGDPWQAVNVFDGDPSTNVVCEGYSKAFKYLCDLSGFSGVNASLVTGYMKGGTGAGPHMWNLVSVNGKNYLVDVTNCDEDTIGAPDKLFMAGYKDHYSEGSQWGYIYEGNSGSQISYLYDSEMSDLYSREELTVEDHNYDPAAENTWTVYFEINNGGGDMEDQTVTEGVPTKLNANTYTPPAGFRFAGWNTEADGSGDAYEDEAEVTLYADLTLFAIWENDSWIVTFAANNGTEETSEQAFPKNHLIATALNPNPFVAPEYCHFKEWNTKANGWGGTSYADKEKIMPDADMTLYAIWEPDAPGFSLDVIDVTSGEHMAGGLIRLSATIEYGDYTEDWNYEDCYGGTNYSGQGRVTVNVEAVPAENYLFVGWYSGVAEDVYQQTLTPVGACQSLNPEWSFVAEGEGTWTPYCAVFRYIPPTIGEADLTLPDDLTRVEDSAFEGIKAASVYVPDACTEIGDNAFKGCASLTRIRLPKECDIKGDDAFEGCRTDPYTLENGEVLVIYAPAGGSTQEWAEEHHILFAAEE